MNVPGITAFFVILVLAGQGADLVVCFKIRQTNGTDGSVIAITIALLNVYILRMRRSTEAPDGDSIQYIDHFTAMLSPLAASQEGPAVICSKDADRHDQDQNTKDDDMPEEPVQNKQGEACCSPKVWSVWLMAAE